MKDKIDIHQKKFIAPNNCHESFLVSFFEEMNLNFKGNWCVLHSYDTLPYFSASDVDMAFSGSNFEKLEFLILETARKTNWVLYQKLWYDVQMCCYYVLRDKKTGTLLAIDFLIDNYGIGRYGFKTTVLTENCNMVNNLIPVPNAETALCYKIVKRIEKGRSLKDDEDYLKKHFKLSDRQNITSFFRSQYGSNGEQMLTSYLNLDRSVLTAEQLDILLRERQKRINNFKTRLRFAYWEGRRIFERIRRPSGMVINIPELKDGLAEEFTQLLAEKVDILFRFVEIGTHYSWLKRIKAVSGSTLIICQLTKFSSDKLIQYGSKNKYLSLDDKESLNFDNLDEVTNQYFVYILKALSLKVNSKLIHNG